MNHAQELLIRRLLKKVPKNTLWGETIHCLIERKHSRLELIQLLSDLKSQNNDCPAVMKSILGPVYQQILNS